MHIWKRLPSSSTRGRGLKATPYELWYGSKPDLAHLRVWGCRAYAHVQRDVRNKLQWHMVKCVFIGYPDGYKGWKLWDPVAKKVIICESVVFDERYFPLSKLAPSSPSFEPPSARPEPSLEVLDPSQLLDVGRDEGTSRPPASARAPRAPAPAAAPIPPAEPPQMRAHSPALSQESPSPPPRLPGTSRSRRIRSDQLPPRRSSRTPAPRVDWHTPAAAALNAHRRGQ